MPFCIFEDDDTDDKNIGFMMKNLKIYRITQMIINLKLMKIKKILVSLMVWKKFHQILLWR